ncbi:MAG: hypothetical protein QOJ97_2436 [Solirubrobacteraceae bacterium]|nr:hypothetical protein [Solirubrobacteraceae bacterium]
MRKISVLAVAAVAFFGLTAVASAANSYKVNIAKVTPTKAGTKLAPKPIGIEFGFGVTSTVPNQRPSVTTDYVIGFGRNIRQNRAVWSSRNAVKPVVCTKVQAGYENGQTPSCPAGSIVGKGVVKNKAGLLGTTTVAADCSIALTLAIGDGKVVNPANNDGKRVKSDLILILEGGPNGVPGRPDAGTCPLTVNKSALAAEFQTVNGGAALAFHVKKEPFQQPQSGVENAVVDVTSKLGAKTVRVKKTVRVNGRNRTVFTTVGLLESVGCTGGGHQVKVKYVDTSNAVNFAQKNAPCRK